MACCPLHNHSEYSAIDGLSTPAEIVARAKEIGTPYIGLTDHGVVAGHIDFAKECEKGGIKPVFGCELYHGLHFGQKKPKRDQAHLIALAMTDEGLKNLWRMNDAAAQEDHFHHVGRVDWEILDKYKEGVVVTSACALSLVCKGILQDDLDAFNRYLDIFGDNFYIELSTYPSDTLFFDSDADEPISPADINLALYDLAQERGVPLVYGDDGHYAFRWQYDAHDAYVAKSTGDSIFTPVDDRKMWHPEGALCIKDEDEVRNALSYLPESAVDEALSNSAALGERADAHLPEVRRHLPVFIPDNSPWVEKGEYADDEADVLFVDLVEEGMYRCYGDAPSERVVEQTMKEVNVFIEAGLHHYFLIDWDMIQFCRAEGIEVGPGRGSAAGCIVARELGITDVDPLPFDLIFERFWNPGRAKGFPDIDTDVEKRRRKEVKDYLSRRWGHDKVRSIGTVTRMKPKALIESLWGACGLTFAEADALKKIVEKTPDLEILGVDQIGWSRETDPGKVYYVMEEVGEEILQWVLKQPEKRQAILVQFLEFCEILCNRVSNYGVHASGVVVSDVRLDDIAPCRFAGSKEQRIPVTQFPMDVIEALMLVKLDLLGLRTLDILSDWKAQMAAEGIDIVWSQLELEEHPEEMWDLMARGFAAGIFQIEDGYPKKLAEEFQPKHVEDFSIINALNRPGPIRSGAPESFIRRRQGVEKTTYDDPFLEDLLDTTYGWFLYQEQVIKFFGKLGYSDSDADAVRKILGKKQPEKWVDLFHGNDEWEGKGYIEMAAKAGIGDISKTSAKAWSGEDVRDEKEKLIFSRDACPAWIIWAKIVDFGKYSFNKSHSLAYGVIGFRALYAKYWAPSAFYMACIRNVDKNKKAERIPAFVNEARRFGIKVYRPDIERSDVLVSVYDGDIYFGFDDIKKVSTEAAKYVVELRDQGIDVSSPEALGAYLEGASKEWSDENKRRKKAGLPAQEGKSPKQRLNAGHIEQMYTAGVWERVEGEKTSIREMQIREKELLSVILSDNTAEAFAEHEEEIAACDLYEEAKAPYTEDVRYQLPGVITHVKEVKTKKDQKRMGIVTMEYEGNTIEFAVFPDSYRSHSFMWNERTPVIVKIKHSLNQKNGRTGYHFESGVML